MSSKFSFSTLCPPLLRRGVRGEVFFVLFFILLANASFAQDAKEYFEIGMKFKEQKQFDSAIVNLSEAILRKEKFEEAYIQRADCYTKFYKYIDAANDYQKLTAVFPKNEDYLKAAGKLYLKGGDYNNAAIYLEAYHKNRDTDEMIIPELIEAKNVSGNYADALMYCNKFEKVFAQNPVFLFGKFKAKKGAEPTSDYYPVLKAGYEGMLNSMEYIKTPQRYHEYLLQYADALLEIKKYNESIFLLNALTKNEGNNSKYYYKRSLIYFEQEKFDSSLIEIQGAFKMSKTNAQYYIHRARIYEKQNKWKEACSDYEIAYENKADCDAVYGRFKCERRGNNIFNSVDLLKKGIELSCSEENYKMYLHEIDSIKASYKEEKIKPIVYITEPLAVEQKLLLKEDQTSVTLKGYIKDDSKIELIMVNDLPVAMNNNFEFSIPVVVKGGDSLRITAIDIWNNVNSALFYFTMVMPDSVKIKLTEPVVKNNVALVKSKLNSSVYIQGSINYPKEKIHRLLLNNTETATEVKEQGVTFESAIDLLPPDTLTIKLTSVSGAVKEISYPVKRN